MRGECDFMVSGAESGGAERVPGAVREDELQRVQTNRIFDQYDRHYGDRHSAEYRRRFLYGPLFGGIDLRGKRVLDAMCGGGYTTVDLLGRGAEVSALDISDEAVSAYRARHAGCDVRACSILDVTFPAGAFDAVVIIGGLHHAQPRVQRAIDEVHRVLKPGGLFFFMEPHSRSLMDVARRAWYRRDAFFEENERAIDMEEIRRGNEGRFVFRKELYGGNLAYLLVLNSAVFRVPMWLKAAYSPALLAIEGLLAPLVPRSLSCIAMGVWEKR